MGILRLSYVELGQHLNRSPAAARLLARRRGWQKVAGNDGRVFVLVDDTEIEQARPPERTAVRSPEQLDADLAMVAGLRERLARLEGAMAAKDTVIAQLEATVAWHRQPWWRRLIGR